jgi:small ligand-binding sensory domain FIST
MSGSSVATGISYGTPARSRHAERAVAQALEKAGLATANSVILFLTSDFAHDPKPALTAAARTGGCTQVFGCTGTGLLTEQEWLLDSSGAAAMVLGGDVLLSPVQDSPGGSLVLSLSTPGGLSTHWLDAPVGRIGALSTDELGHGPFSVWNSARVVRDGHAHVLINGTRHSVTVGQGVRALTAPLEVAEVQGFDIRRLGNYPALNVLVNSLPASVREMERIPLHMLMCGVTFGDPHTAIREGRFRLDHIVSANPQDSSITLSHPLTQGERLFWAMRDKITAERGMSKAIERGEQELGTTPDFALLFPCISRGPSFFGGGDRDIDLLKEKYPDMPFIGFYGNGEIAPLSGGSHLYQYSTVLGLFSAQPPS